MNDQTALSHASRGWFVVPCGKNKRPITAHGYLDASTDPEIIKSWWARCPDALIGIACARSGFFALDVDMPQGFESLASLVEQYGAGIRITPGISQDTPRGGAHYLFNLPANIRVPHRARLAQIWTSEATGLFVPGRGIPGLKAIPPTKAL